MGKMENEQGSCNSHTRCLSVFEDELSPLDDSYRRFVAESFEMICRPWFWYVPAAMGGKNHPWACRSVGGLVKHTKLAVWWAHRLIQLRGDVLGEQQQEIIAAVLLHDICKFEKPAGVEGANTDGRAVNCHGHWAAWAMWEAWAGVIPLIGRKSFGRISDAVAWHMGQWSEGAPVNCSQWDEFGKVVYEVVSMADYLAASKVGEKIKELAALNVAQLEGGEA